MTVRLKIKELREKRGLSQRQIADELGITEGNYRRLENNKVKNISFETIDFLCSFFSCSTDGIFEIIKEQCQYFKMNQIMKEDLLIKLGGEDDVSSDEMKSLGKTKGKR